MDARRKKQQFVAGDLVYYRGFDIFERQPREDYMGIVVGLATGAEASNTYHIFWFKSSLTTRMHCDNMILVYETKCISEE
jgi:hypothetical protein